MDISEYVENVDTSSYYPDPIVEFNLNPPEDDEEEENDIDEEDINDILENPFIKSYHNRHLTLNKEIDKSRYDCTMTPSTRSSITTLSELLYDSEHKGIVSSSDHLIGKRPPLSTEYSTDQSNSIKYATHKDDSKYISSNSLFLSSKYGSVNPKTHEPAHGQLGTRQRISELSHMGRYTIASNDPSRASSNIRYMTRDANDHEEHDRNKSSKNRYDYKRTVIENNTNNNSDILMIFSIAIFIIKAIRCIIKHK